MSLSIPAIRVAVATDFAARSITAEVLFGDWKTYLNAGANVVILGLGGYEPIEPTNAPSPIEVSPVDGATLAQHARITGDVRNQVVPVWVHTDVPNVAPGLYAESCQSATAELLHEVIRALRGYAKTAFSWRAGKWPKPERTEFTHGSLTTFEAVFRIPVFDDRMDAIDGDDVSGVVSSEYE